MPMVKSMFKQKERGAALVEFALVLPLLLLIIFGIIEFSILFYDKAVITNASREAAREFAIFKAPPATKAELDLVVSQYAEDRMISIADDNAPSLETTPSDPTTKGTGTNYVVAKVNYTYKFVFMPGFMADLLPEIDLSATTTMRNEAYQP